MKYIATYAERYYISLSAREDGFLLGLTDRWYRRGPSEYFRGDLVQLAHVLDARLRHYRRVACHTHGIEFAFVRMLQEVYGFNVVQE